MVFATYPFVPNSSKVSFATVPVIASGGAGSAQDFVTLFNEIPEITYISAYSDELDALVDVDTAKNLFNIEFQKYEGSSWIELSKMKHTDIGEYRYRFVIKNDYSYKYIIEEKQKIEQNFLLFFKKISTAQPVLSKV